MANNRWRAKLKYRYKYNKQLPVSTIYIETINDNILKRIKRIRKRPWYPEFYVFEKLHLGCNHRKRGWKIGKDNKLKELYMPIMFVD